MLGTDPCTGSSKPRAWSGNTAVAVTNELGSYGVPRLEADAPNKVWTWDITALRGPTKGVKYFLYTIIDIYSRKITGWTVHDAESETHARRLIREACRRHGVNRDQLVIHADRGSPMIAGTVAELLNELGVGRSHSRPRVSNDNLVCV